MYIIIPPVLNDIDALISRLKKFYGVQIQILDDRLLISGSPDKLVEAQNYALRFISPETTTSVCLSTDCFSVFQHADIVRHFEEQFELIISVKGLQELQLKGRHSDTARFKLCLKTLEENSRHCPPILTPLKQENLRLLCQKFSVPFHELPPRPSIQMALLIHFSSLLDSNAPRSGNVTKPPPFMEVYRKPNVEAESVLKNYLPNPVSLRRTDTASSGLSKRGRSASTRRKPKLNIETNPSNGSKRLRSVVIDGSNVAFAHGKQQKFSPDGIWLALNFFIKRGHTNVVAVVPRYRQNLGGKLFDRLERAGYLCYSSSRIVNDVHQVADDDKIILQLAIETDAVVVSNDQFRNYRDINEQFRDVIDNRLLPYTLALNTFLIPDDPHGRKGRSLSECLCLPDDHED